MIDTIREIRCFIGIPAPKELANRLNKQVRLWRDSNEFPDYKWVKRQDYHLTLHFIGELHPTKVQKLIDKLKSVPRVEPGASIQFKSITGFPEKEKARFLVAECEATEVLQSIQEQTGTVLKELGIPSENGAFRPHISLGRLKPGHKPPELGEIMKLDGDCALSEIAVFRSILTPEGSHYEVLARIS
ncbi:MAG: RNA 2',3'-cyclic phosphodiesterase [Proteobacteria bacterium]|nr:MAG: RNA 2',3'-cyclic phosphodiesterase [Pseudomonadota bacterium]